MITVLKGLNNEPIPAIHEASQCGAFIVSSILSGNDQLTSIISISSILSSFRRALRD